MWYALRTPPFKEIKIKDVLSDNNFGVFIPMRLKKKQRGDQVKIVEDIAVGGYVFVSVTEENPLQTCLEIIRETYPTVNPVRSLSGEAHRISDFDIQMMKMVQEQSENGLSFVDKGVIKPGKKVLITNGVLAGKEGELVRKSKKRYVCVRLKSFDQDVVFEIPMKDIRVYNSDEKSDQC